MANTQSITATRASHTAATAANDAMRSVTLFGNGFKAGDKGSKLSASGAQTIAAACFMLHAENESSKPQFTAYGEGGEAFSNFKAECVKAFVTTRLTIKAIEGVKNGLDTMATTNAANAAQMQALNKGLQLAIALNACGVSVANFNPSTGLFSVPVTALIGADGTPKGALRKLAQVGGMVPLNGVTYAYEIGEDEAPGHFTAYPARVLEVAGYKKAKTSKAAAKEVAAAVNKSASDTSTTGGASAAEVRANIDTWSYDALIAAAGELLNRAADIEREGPAVGFDSLPEATRNALEAIAIFCDECKMIDAATIHPGNHIKTA